MGLVSVIIPVYNNHTELMLLLDSLLISAGNLDKYDIEIIVIDNLSNPPIKLNYEYLSFCKLFTCEVKGSYAARNKGVAASKGDILVFTDSDCVVNKDWLSSGIEALHNISDKRIVGGEVLFNLSEKPTVVELYQYISGFMQEENIRNNNFSATANLFVYREHFNDVGFFDSTLFSAGDREWCWRAHAKGYALVFADNCIVFTRARIFFSELLVQARRVTGGRFKLKRHYDGRYENIKPNRGVLSSTLFIIRSKKISSLDKIYVIFIATILKACKFIEYAKLKLRYKPENR